MAGRASVQSACVNGSNSRSINLGSMPAPVSATRSTARSPAGSEAMVTVVIPPGGVNLTALWSRFPITCVRRVASASTISGSLASRGSSRTPWLANRG